MNEALSRPDARRSWFAASRCGVTPAASPINGEEEAEDLEHKLPITKGVRTRLLAWAEKHYRYDGGERSIDMSGFDEEGLLLSRELQRELGSACSVQYSFTFEGSRGRLMPLVGDDRCPGWRVR